MSVPTKLVPITAINGEWVAADKLWFEEHPGVDWYVRSVWSDDELASLNFAQPGVVGYARRLAESHPSGRGELSVIVLQLEPGKRQRRLLAGPGPSSQKVILLNEETGKDQSPEEYLIWLRSLEMATDEEAAELDDCVRCGRPFRDVEALMQNGLKTAQCIPCAHVSVREGVIFHSGSIHIGHDAMKWPQPKFRRELDKQVSRLKAACKMHGVHLVEKGGRS